MLTSHCKETKQPHKKFKVDWFWGVYIPIYPRIATALLATLFQTLDQRTWGGLVVGDLQKHACSELHLATNFVYTQLAVASCGLRSPSREGRRFLLGVVADLTRLEMAKCRCRRNKPIFHGPSVVVDDRLLSWRFTGTFEHTCNSAAATQFAVAFVSRL